MPQTFTSLKWHPQALNAKLTGAFRVAAAQTKAAAQARNPAPSRIGIRLSRRGEGVYRLSGEGPLAHLFEGGTTPHTIAPLYYAANILQSGGSASGTALSSLGRRTRAFDRGKGGAFYALKFRDGGYVRAAVQHPGMKAEPYIQPAARVFPELYRRAARAALTRAA